jgi:hypothetical protein
MFNVTPGTVAKLGKAFRRLTYAALARAWFRGRLMPNGRDHLPRFIEPQLSSLVKAPPSGAGWVHALKNMTPIGSMPA